MTNQEFRALLDLFMCSDPWPVDDKGENQTYVENLANRESESRGYQDWIEAYHEFKGEC